MSTWPLWSIILRPWPDEPIYHRLNMKEGPLLTACGRVFGPYMPLLPTKHVVKFARPCRGCFK